MTNRIALMSTRRVALALLAVAIGWGVVHAQQQYTPPSALQHMFLQAGDDAMSDDSWNGLTLSGWNCGETISQWDAVYLDDTSNEWMQADADAAGEFPARGVAVSGCTNGTAGVILVQGTIRNDGWSWSANGATLYLSDTVAGITQTAPSTSGDAVQVVGFSINDDQAYLNFSGHWLEVE